VAKSVIWVGAFILSQVFLYDDTSITEQRKIVGACYTPKDDLRAREQEE
jgi:hypothetical protein